MPHIQNQKGKPKHPKRSQTTTKVLTSITIDRGVFIVRFDRA